MYPADPRPVTVEVKLGRLKDWPRVVEKEENDKETKFVVEINDDVKDCVEIYPAEPRPVTVDVRFVKLKGKPRAVLKEEKLCDTKLVVEMREAVLM